MTDKIDALRALHTVALLKSARAFALLRTENRARALYAERANLVSHSSDNVKYSSPTSGYDINIKNTLEKNILRAGFFVLGFLLRNSSFYFI